MPEFANLPSHARIAFNLGGSNSGTFEIYLLECIVYEEMCALDNLWHQQSNTIKTGDTSKVQNKTYSALAHATTNAAVYFVEAFINGIACEYLLDHDVTDQKDSELLAEWDSKKDRARFVNLRDKLLQYPRIATGSEHPPITESNCVELKFLVDTAIAHRDALAHPSAKPAADGLSKEDILLNPTDALVEQTVDSVIKLTRRLQSIVRPTKSIKWLIGREQSGEFPGHVFS